MSRTIERGYLPDLMRARADADGLCADHPVRAAAEDMEMVAISRESTPLQIRRAAIHARKLWVMYTGGSLYAD
jgi:hypothetical protein